MAKVRARVEGRVGAPIRQPLLDLRKLLTKERVHAEHASAALPIVPFVVAASVVVAVAISPLISTSPALSESADLLVVVSLLLAGSVALAIGGLDTGTAFGGMGASRAMTIGALAEPALLVAVVALAIQAGSTNLGDRRGDPCAPRVGRQPRTAPRARGAEHRRPRRDGQAPRRQSLDPPRAHDDPRGDGA